MDASSDRRRHSLRFLFTRFQDVVLRSTMPLHLENYITHTSLEGGTEIPIRLMSCEVLVAIER